MPGAVTVATASQVPPHVAQRVTGFQPVSQARCLCHSDAASELPVPGEVRQIRAKMTSGFRQGNRRRIAFVNEFVTVFAHGLCSLQDRGCHGAIRGDRVQEILRRRTRVPAETLPPVPAECCLEKRKHTDQVRILKIVVTIPDVTRPKGHIAGHDSGVLSPAVWRNPVPSLLRNLERHARQVVHFVDTG